MNDTSSPQPTRQPLSVHGEHHSHGSLHLIVGMLGVLLVLETIVFGYVVTQYVDLQNEQEAVLEKRAEIAASKLDDEDILPVPFLYIKTSKYGSGYGSELYRVNRQTGEENLLIDFGNTHVGWLLAIPQVGYDGRVFIHKGGEGTDNPYLNLISIDLTSDDRAEVPVAGLSEPQTDVLNAAVVVSPDQTKIAYIPFNSTAPEGVSPSPELKVLNLLTGVTTTLSRLEGESTFVRYGANIIGGTLGPVVFWRDNSCVDVFVYPSTTSETGGKSEIFCD